MLFFLDKVVKLIGRGSVINGAPSSFLLDLRGSLYIGKMSGCMYVCVYVSKASNMTVQGKFRSHQINSGKFRLIHVSLG